MAVRDSRPERAGVRAADVGGGCGGIRKLLAERAPEASPWEKPDHIADEPGARYDCWTCANSANGRPRASRSSSWPRAATGREARGRASRSSSARTTRRRRRRLARYGAEVVYLADDPALADYHPELWAEALRPGARSRRPHVLLIPATGRGRDYGPRAAGELELGMTADCVGVDIAKAGRLLQQKPAYGGNIVSVILGATTLSSRPCCRGCTSRSSLRDGRRVRDRATRPRRLTGAARARGPAPDLRTGTPIDIDDADVVVCASAPGVGSPEPIRFVEMRWSRRKPGAAVGRGPERSARRAGCPERARSACSAGRSRRACSSRSELGDEEQAPGFVKAGGVVAALGDEDRSDQCGRRRDRPGDWRKTLQPLHDRVSAGLRS